MEKVGVDNSRECPSDPWADKAFVAEMEDGYREYRSGKVKLISLDEAEERAREAARLRKVKQEKIDSGHSKNPI